MLHQRAAPRPPSSLGASGSAGLSWQECVHTFFMGFSQNKLHFPTWGGWGGQELEAGPEAPRRLAAPVSTEENGAWVFSRARLLTSVSYRIV